MASTARRKVAPPGEWRYVKEPFRRTAHKARSLICALEPAEGYRWREQSFSFREDGQHVPSKPEGDLHDALTEACHTPIDNGRFRLPQLTSELQKLKRLESDWNGYGAEPPNKTACRGALVILILLQLEGMTPPRRLAPSAEGGIAIIFRSGENYADFECLNTGDITVTLANDASEPDVWEVSSTNQIAEAVSRIHEFIGG